MLSRAEGTPGTRWILAVLVVTLSTIAACGDEPVAPVVEMTDPDTLVYAPALGVDLSVMTKRSSGLYVQDLLVGDGEVAVAGDVLRMAYTNWLHNGDRIDSSEFPTRGPYEFRLGVSPIIPGLEEGVLGMAVGGTRLLVIPPQLAYGSDPLPPLIPGGPRSSSGSSCSN